MQLETELNTKISSECSQNCTSIKLHEENVKVNEENLHDLDFVSFLMKQQHNQWTKFETLDFIKNFKIWIFKWHQQKHEISKSQTGRKKTAKDISSNDFVSKIYQEPFKLRNKNIKSQNFLKVQMF